MTETNSLTEIGEVSTTENNSNKNVESIAAYALVGWLIGTFVPLTGGIMLYVKSLYETADAASNSEYNLFGIALIIEFLCSVTGAVCGALIGGLMIFLRSLHYALTIIFALIGGVIWGIITGFVGGFPVFVVGGIFGAIIAAPFGLVGFTTFAAIYETAARKNGGVPGWRKTFIFALGTLLLTMIGGAILLGLYIR